jgi:hypothetical protein
LSAVATKISTGRWDNGPYRFAIKKIPINAVTPNTGSTLTRNTPFPKTAAMADFKRVFAKVAIRIP